MLVRAYLVVFAMLVLVLQGFKEKSQGLGGTVTYISLLKSMNSSTCLIKAFSVVRII